MEIDYFWLMSYTLELCRRGELTTEGHSQLWSEIEDRFKPFGMSIEDRAKEIDRLIRQISRPGNDGG